MKWWPGDPKRGDIIRIPVGAIYHYGIFVDYDTVVQFGPPPGTSGYNDGKDIKVCTASPEEFSCGKIVEVAVLDKDEQKRRIPPEQTVNTAVSRIGEGGYDLLHNNCEHFVNECVFGEKRSAQEEEARKRWYDRPVFDCYFAAVPEELSFEEYSGKIVPEQRLEYIRSTSDEKLRRSRLFVWELLEAAAVRSFGFRMDELALKKDKCGCWTSGRMEFSMTHTDNVAAVVVSNAPAGIDAADTDVLAHSGISADSILTRKEKKILSGVTGDELAVLLTRKESIFKSMKKMSFSPVKTEASQKNTLSMRLTEFPGYIFSVHGEKAGALRCYVYNGGKFTRTTAEMTGLN